MKQVLGVGKKGYMDGAGAGSGSSNFHLAFESTELGMPDEGSTGAEVMLSNPAAIIY